MTATPATGWPSVRPWLPTAVWYVGGGGLIAGSATAAKGLQDRIRVIGVEPEAGDDTKQSLEVGRRISIPVPRTIADGQAADDLIGANSADPGRTKAPRPRPVSATAG